MIIPSSAIQIIAGCIDLVSDWINSQCIETERISFLKELNISLQPHRGFRDFPDVNRSTARFGDTGVEYIYGERKH